MPSLSIRSRLESAPSAALWPALDGARCELESESTGRVSWYQSAPETASDPVPLLLVHSINAVASAYEMKPLYEHYARERPVYALDLPGFGLSARDRRLYSPRLMTDALHALVAHIRREHSGVPIDALALSLSAEYLARAAVEVPDAFRSVALVSPTGFNARKLREGPPGSTLGRRGILSFFNRPAVGHRLFSLLTRRAVIAYFLRRTWGSRDIDRGLLDYDYASARMPGAEHAPLHFLSGFLFSGDSGLLYRALEQPVWMVHGVRGDFTNYRGIVRLSDRPNWRVETMPTGALPYFELPREFVRRYDAWRTASLRA